MAFLNPFLLFGLAAIAAPIIIHLFMNRRVKPVVWAAMRFLQASVEKNQKRMNLENLLLLLLRCLLLLLLALALARPVFQGKGEAALGRGSETAIIAIDNSYSMGQSDGVSTRFDLARQAAEQVIDAMPAGSSTAVMLFSDVVKAPIPEPTYDLNLARKVVRDAALSDRPTNVEVVIKQALETLERHPGSLPKIYLVTDGQANAWNQFEDIAKMLRNASAKSTVILVGGTENHNLCVSDLRLASSMASVGEAAQFDAEVTNFGTTDAGNVPVRLSVDAEPPCDEGMIPSIPPGASKRLALFTKFHTAGYHTVTAQTNADHLPADDRRSIAVRALNDVRVLLVSGDFGGDPAGNATFYLANALSPVPPPEREKYFVKTRTISPAEMESTKLGDYEAVVLANVPDIPASAVDAMAAYLKRGGGLIIFPGPKTNVSFYNDNFVKKYNFLPAIPGIVRGKPNEQKTALKLQAKGYDNRIVSIWNDPAAGTLSSANFYCSMELTPVKGHSAQAGEAQVVVKYNDGTPAIMERTWGRGRVILFSSSANTAWNDMPLHPAYLPLMDRALGAIIERQDAQLNIPVGSPFEFVCVPDWIGKDALIVHAGDNKEASSLRRISVANDTPLLRFEETEKSGAYEASVGTEPPTTIKFAAQSDPVESDLRELPAARLESLSRISKVVRWTPKTRLDEMIARERGGTEIWTILAVLVIIIACTETVLGGVYSASK
jgi:hypothetical protein